MAHSCEERWVDSHVALTGDWSEYGPIDDHLSLTAKRLTAKSLRVLLSPLDPVTNGFFLRDEATLLNGHAVLAAPQNYCPYPPLRITIKEHLTYKRQIFL